jgi:anti-sigma factor ChrR (cupin superfamily)
MNAFTMLVAASGLGLISSATAYCQTAVHGHSADHRVYTPEVIRWSAGPPSLPRGAEAALLYGDPSRDGPFALRLRFPDGYLVAPHRHGGVEILTVISGTFSLGAGEDAGKGEVTRLPAGSFATMPAGMPHYARAEGTTVIQINSLGPWSVTYINPADDPRRR